MQTTTPSQQPSGPSQQSSQYLRIVTLIVTLCFLLVKFKHFIDQYSIPLNENITFIWLYFFIYAPMMIGAIFLFYTHIRALILFSMISLLYSANAAIEVFNGAYYFLSPWEAGMGFLLFILIFFHLKDILKQQKAQRYSASIEKPKEN